MHLDFKNDKEEIFTLGSVSFGFLNTNNIFDKYQQDNDFYSEAIFYNSKAEKLKELARDIKICLSNNPKIREDISKKLNDFSEFVKISNSIKAVIT